MIVLCPRQISDILRCRGFNNPFPIIQICTGSYRDRVFVCTGLVKVSYAMGWFCVIACTGLVAVLRALSALRCYVHWARRGCVFTGLIEVVCAQGSSRFCVHGARQGCVCTKLLEVLCALVSSNVRLSTGLVEIVYTWAPPVLRALIVSMCCELDSPRYGVLVGVLRTGLQRQCGVEWLRVYEFV